MSRQRTGRRYSPAVAERQPAAVVAAHASSPEPVLATIRVASSTVDWLVVVALIGIGLAAYYNSFAGAFVFDDDPWIVQNDQIRHLWPPSLVLAGRNRPVLEYSLALSYALGGLKPWGYHAFNLAVHVAAGLLLFGIVRRMFRSERLRERYGSAARWLAASAAALWLVHPLQTESVTYIVQRTESLMGMFFLLTVYCGIRACESSQPRGWAIAAVAACALGMGTKEVMVSAPLLMLLYDRTFLASSFATALRARWPLYAGLAATWLVLAASLANIPAHEHLVPDTSPIDYALAQFGVIVYYLRLSLWPSPLIFDYLWPTASNWSAVVAPATVVLVLVGGTVWALYRRLWVGFWGAWFFLVLAPTSSVMPIADVLVEHRMYLPLAAVAVLVLAGGYALVTRLARSFRWSERLQVSVQAALLIVAVFILGALTVTRNADYRSEVALWTDTLAKRPEHYRAHNNLGAALVKENKLSEGRPHIEKALRLKPDYVHAHANMGILLFNLKDFSGAVAEFEQALQLNPDLVGVHNNLGNALLAQGNVDEAIVNYRESLARGPNHAETHVNLAGALLRQGNVAEAISHCREAVRLVPDSADAHACLGDALARDQNFPEAVREFRAALRLKPENAEAHNGLGLAFASQQMPAEAIEQYREALRIKPEFPEAHYNFAVDLSELGNLADAIVHYRKAIELRPDYALARVGLGNALFARGDISGAIAEYEQASRIAPTNAEAHNNLGFALATQGRLGEAIAQYREALRLKPDYEQAQNNLREAQAAASRGRDPR